MLSGPCELTASEKLSASRKLITWSVERLTQVLIGQVPLPVHFFVSPSTGLVKVDSDVLHWKTCQNVRE